MSGLDSTINEAVERSVGASISQGESNRQEQWSAKRKDDESLRSGLSSATEHMDNPRPKGLGDDASEYDRFGAFGDIRKMAQSAYDETFVDAEKQERRQRDAEQFELIGKRLKRTHGVDAIEGINQLMAAEEALRKSPAEALGFLYQQYAAGGFGQDVQQTEYRNTMGEVDAFFKAHVIPPDIENLMVQRMKAPEFERTGDTDADLRRAYREATKGARHVRIDRR